MAQSLCFTVWYKPFAKARLKPLNVSVHAPNLEEAKRAYRARGFDTKLIVFRREATCATPGSSNQCSCAKLVAYAPNPPNVSQSPRTSKRCPTGTPTETVHERMMRRQFPN
jgi:hypothetical protein